MFQLLKTEKSLMVNLRETPVETPIDALEDIDLKLKDLRIIAD